MDLEIYTLSYDSGLGMTLADWGITSCKVATTSNGDDKMELVFATPLTAREPFTPFKKIELFDAGNVRRFVGYFIQSAQNSSGSKESRTFTFFSPWELIKRIAIMQQVLTLDGLPGSVFGTQGASPGPALVTGNTGDLAYMSKVTLNFDIQVGYPSKGTPAPGDPTIYAFPAKLSAAEMIAFALQAAIDFGVDFAFDVSGLPTLYPPTSQHTDISIAEVVNVELRWIPAATIFWDYTVEPPKLIFTADLGEPITMTGLSEVRGKPRYDLLIPRMEIFYIVKKFTNTLAGVIAPGIYHDVSTSSLGFGTVSHQYELNSGMVMGENVFDGEGAAVGLAAALHVPFVDLWHELEFETVRENVDWAYRVGHKFTIEGTGIFANANTVCQSITRDILSGSVRYSCGIPGHLGVYIRNLRGFAFARTIAPRQSEVQHTPEPNDDFTVTICEGGSPVQKKFLMRGSS